MQCSRGLDLCKEPDLARHKISFSFKFRYRIRDLCYPFCRIRLGKNKSINTRHHGCIEICRQGTQTAIHAN
ncbi:hypothetical protein MESS2_880015 [Mesorhizobium metallidurans STM 2683]|uniref:Uncharacterized protein n=1 Tax=Mesorhizobium metallidurans STM 2683 TaxID=1297569 RepID=M5EYZ9_9HYPH|nr:hypothetical protein MESS2_880015 [Mesorhizobium metallidurans STM 2683]